MSRKYLRLVLSSIIVSCFLPLAISFASTAMSWISADGSPKLNRDMFLYGGPWVGLAIVFSLLVATGFSRWSERLHVLFLKQGSAIDALDERYIELAIVGAAGFSLFFELVMIRWLASVYPFFCFYKNFILLSCFVGLGAGYAVARHEELALPVVAPLALWIVIILLYIRYVMSSESTMMVMTLAPFTEQLHMGFFFFKRIGFLFFLTSHMFLAVVFLLNGLLFVPIGQLCGRLMERCNKLRAYGMNLLGSILGVALMFMTSYLWLPPLAWFEPDSR